MGHCPWKLLLISLLSFALGCSPGIHPLFEKAPQKQPPPPASPHPPPSDPPRDESGTNDDDPTPPPSEPENPSEENPSEENPSEENPSEENPTSAICKENDKDKRSSYWNDLLTDLQGIEQIPTWDCLWIFAEFAQLHFEIVVFSHKLHGVQNALHGLCKKGWLQDFLKDVEKELHAVRNSKEFKSCTKAKKK